MKILERIHETKTKMTIRSAMTVWAENIEGFMEDYMNELKESYNTYSLVSMAEKDKPLSSPYSSAKYQEDLLNIRKSVIGNLDMAKIAIEENRKLVESLHSSNKIDVEFYNEMKDIHEEVDCMIMMSLIQVDVVMAKYKGSKSIDLTINFDDENVCVSSL